MSNNFQQSVIDPFLLQGNGRPQNDPSLNAYIAPQRREQGLACSGTLQASIRTEPSTPNVPTTKSAHEQYRRNILNTSEAHDVETTHLHSSRNRLGNDGPSHPGEPTTSDNNPALPVDYSTMASKALQVAEVAQNSPRIAAESTPASLDIVGPLPVQRIQEEYRSSLIAQKVSLPTPPLSNHDNESRHQRASNIVKSLDPVIEDALNAVIYTHVDREDLSIPTKARNAKDAIVAFFEQHASLSENMPRPDPDTIVDICEHVMKEEGTGPSSKALRIAPRVVLLFEDMKWFLPRNTAQSENLDPSVNLDGTLEPHCESTWAANSSPVPEHHKRAGIAINSSSSSRSSVPPHKRQKQVSIASSAHSLEGRSVTESRSRSILNPASSASWKCKERGCKQKKPSSCKKDFDGHYHLHFPSVVMACPLSNNRGIPCLHISNKPGNLKDHLRVHGYKDAKNIPSELERDLDEHSFQILDIFHDVCPFCVENYPLKDRDVSKRHIMEHYADGSSETYFSHRCSREHNWRYSENIPSAFWPMETKEGESSNSASTNHGPHGNPDSVTHDQGGIYPFPGGSNMDGMGQGKNGGSGPSGGSRGSPGYYQAFENCGEMLRSQLLGLKMSLFRGACPAPKCLENGSLFGSTSSSVGSDNTSDDATIRVPAKLAFHPEGTPILVNRYVTDFQRHEAIAMGFPTMDIGSSPRPSIQEMKETLNVQLTQLRGIRTSSVWKQNYSVYPDH